MTTLIHILHLEDDPADAELIRALVEETDLPSQITDVRTRDEYERALQQNSYGVILADFKLPMYDGMSALRLAKKLQPDTPFIFVSGTMGEEAAIEGLTQGATDYVLKHNLSRLPSAVERALDEAHNRRHRQMAEKALAQSERKMRSIMKNIGVGVALISPKMEILEMNRRMRQWFPGVDPNQHPICHKSFNTPPRQAVCSYCPTSKTLRDGQVHEATTQTPQEGMIRNYRIVASPLLDAEGKVIAAIEMVEDITERKQLEDKLRQIQKVEAIGQLAGGIAHDFNNILSAIIGYTELSQSSLEPESPVFDYLGQVLEAGQRAKELIDQILMFSRETAQELRPIRVSLPVEEALNLIRASVPSFVEIRSKILSEASALADPTQVHQIVMNLCTNAAHAMREKGGLLRVELTDITIDSEELHKHYPDAHTGQFIRLTVSDQGHGIDAQYIHRIFDPFFTTKKMGEGTGMGLSVVHGIVKSYGGFIYAHSREEQGSTFEILIPAQECSQTYVTELDTPIPTGSESVLFVDDETMIVDIVDKILKSLGYRVVAKTDAIEALEAFKNNPDNFDLVVTDMAMPKMSGLDLAEEIQKIKPGFPIVLCTGFDVKMNAAKIAEHGLSDIIYKPILRLNMATVVRNTLDRQ